MCKGEGHKMVGYKEFYEEHPEIKMKLLTQAKADGLTILKEYSIDQFDQENSIIISMVQDAILLGYYMLLVKE